MMSVIEKVLNGEEVRQFRSHLDAATWQDGAQSAGTLARAIKHNQQLADGTEPALSLGQHILRALGQNPQFVSAALPSRIYPPKFNRYAGGGTYGVHVDSAVMAVPGTQITLRSDLSATLFLSEPDEYDGGELQIEDRFGMQSVKLEAGDLRAVSVEQPASRDAGDTRCARRVVLLDPESRRRRRRAQPAVRPGSRDPGRHAGARRGRSASAGADGRLSQSFAALGRHLRPEEVPHEVHRCVARGLCARVVFRRSLGARRRHVRAEDPARRMAVSHNDLYKKLTDEGWVIRQMKEATSCYEVYAKDPKGKRVEAFFHPKTFERVE